MARKKTRITRKDAKQIRAHLAEIDSILDKYDERVYSPSYVSSFFRMCSHYREFKEWFELWTKNY